jgi:large subunit ribosomal protein L24
MAGKNTKPFEGKLQIRTGDTVEIIAGKDKGRQGKVLRVLPKEGKVIVEGLNITVRHKKAQPTQNNPNPPSGRIEQPAPILACKVMLVGSDGKPTRIRIQQNEDGSKERIGVRTGQPIPTA